MRLPLLLSAVVYCAVAAPQSGSGSASVNSKASVSASGSGVSAGASANAAVALPVTVDPNTKMIIVGMRHGNRNPENFLKNDANKGKWGDEGALQLTQIGKRQGYAVGKNLKERYPFLIPNLFNVDLVKAMSSSAERAQMTLQSCMAGAFAPTPGSPAEFAKDLDWQPIPYTINNPMLRMYAVSECKPQADAWKPISDDNLPELKKMISDNKDLMAYIAKNTALNATSLSDMADVADNLMDLHMLNLPLPDWVTKSTLSGHTGDIYKEVIKFSEAHTIMCANYKPCGRLMGGLWLNDLITVLQKKSSAAGSKLQVQLYAAHTEITLSVMKLMNMDENEVPTSGGFIIEYRDKPSQQIRQLYHVPVEDNPDKRTITISPLTVPCKGATSDGWCPLQTFIDNVKANSFSDWQGECKLSNTCNPLSG